MSFVKTFRRLFDVNIPSNQDESNPLVIHKRVTRFLLQAGLFWNNGPISDGHVCQDGLFYWHNSMSAGEQFYRFMESIGVLLRDGRRGFRLAIREDAVDLYADYLIEKGLEIETVIDALVCVGGESWLETTREPFPANFYDNQDGTASFDCRQLMLDLVSLEYAELEDGLYVWTSKMESVLKAHYM
jgi:hypothetical protein